MIDCIYIYKYKYRCICIHDCMYVYIYTIHTYVYTYKNVYVCMYVCMYVYIYIHTYTFIGISGNHEQAGVSFQALEASSELQTAKAIEYILGYTQNVLSDKMMINHGIWKIYQICVHRRKFGS